MENKANAENKLRNLPKNVAVKDKELKIILDAINIEDVDENLIKELVMVNQQSRNKSMS